MLLHLDQVSGCGWNLRGWIVQEFLQGVPALWKMKVEPSHIVGEECVNEAITLLHAIAHRLLPRIMQWSFSKGSSRIISLTLYRFSSRTVLSCRKISDGSFETSMLLAFTANRNSPLSS